jgi:putative ABC transport system ATP-binding protein
VFLGDVELSGLKDKALTQLRRDRIGFIFQSLNLVPTLSARENILLPLAIAGRKPEPQWYDVVIQTVGLGDRLDHRPTELSGGQQQRVACARALLSRPRSSLLMSRPAISTQCPAWTCWSSCADPSTSSVRPS